MPGRLVRRLLCSAAAGVAVVACGSSTSTVTLQVSGAGGSLDVVVTGDQNSVNSFEQGVTQAVSSGEAAGANVQTVNGDQHSGSLICQTSVSSNGESAQIAVYSTISGLDSSICTQIQQSVQSGS
jgi:hypothetical protein